MAALCVTGCVNELPFHRCMASPPCEGKEGVREGRGEGVSALIGWKVRRKRRRRRQLRADKQLRASQEKSSVCDPGEVDSSTEEEEEEEDGGEMDLSTEEEEGEGGGGGGEEGEKEEEDERREELRGGEEEGGGRDGTGEADRRKRSETVAMETNRATRHAEVRSRVFVQLDRPVKVQVCGRCAVYTVFLAYLMPFQHAVHCRGMLYLP